MASLHIAEFAGLAAAPNNTDVLATPAAPNATQVVALGATSTPSAVLQATTTWLKLTAGGPCSIAIGATPVAAVGGWFLQSGEIAYVRVPANSGYEVAALTDTP
jgi:hypothetical protein